MGKRQNVDPAQLPWSALQTVLASTLYGGKIDNDFDAKVLNSLVS